jgi:hypothetical protein
MVTIFELNVTAPLLAKALPTNSAPLLSVMDSVAIMVPTKLEFVPSVAEVPICQKTLLA